MKEVKRYLRKFDTIEEAEEYVKKMVKDDCSLIGIKNWDTINYILSVKDHQYVIEKSNYQNVHGYIVYLKVRVLA